jgi:anti-sigma regulatory factor (Ser/Thr protein kinase)
MEKRFLIARWLGSTPTPTPIYDEASVSSARERVREAGHAIGASKNLIETVALIASELTHNQLAHARQGYLGVRTIERSGAQGLEVVAADLGPGLERAILTGTPIRQAGSLGAGLEGVFRLADEVEVDSRGAEGLCVVARKCESRAESPWEFAIAGQPYPGEIISGDDAICLRSDSGFVAAVCDGLGHGPEARLASNRAVESIGQSMHLGPIDILTKVNADLSETRGCAMGLSLFRNDTRTLQCVLAGDVRAQVYHLRDAHYFANTPMVVGEREIARRRIRVEEFAVVPGSVLILFTDGLETKTTLKGRLDVLRLPAIVIAQHLLEIHSRATDDSTVFVARLK